MNSISEHNSMSNIIDNRQERVTTYLDNVDSLFNRIVALERRIEELENKDCSCK
jgi:polyhydroxyalkanoate synthesis regulator phasin